MNGKISDQKWKNSAWQRNLLGCREESNVRKDMPNRKLEECHMSDKECFRGLFTLCETVEEVWDGMVSKGMNDIE